MDIHDTLNEAITLVEEGKQRAFGAGVVVDQQQLLDVLQRAHALLPEEVLQAGQVIADRDALLAQAQTRAADIEAEANQGAAQIREHAEREREALLADHALLEEAQERGRALFRHASDQAQAKTSEADAYAEARLAALAETLSHTLQVVEAGRERLQDSQAAAQDSGEDVVAVR